MARKFKTTAIVDPVKAPISKRSLTHINTAWDELGEDIVRGLLGTYTTNDVIVLYGCVVTANIPGTSSVTAGAIYYNGRIYKVDANASISTPSNTLVWSIIESTITGDPATFSDSSSQDFHVIEKFRLTNAATGTGLADYDAATVKYASKFFRAQNTTVGAGSSANVTSTSNEISGTEKSGITEIDFSCAIVTTNGSAVGLYIPIPTGFEIDSEIYSGNIFVVRETDGTFISGVSRGSGSGGTRVEIGPGNFIRIEITGTGVGGVNNYRVIGRVSGMSI